MHTNLANASVVTKMMAFFIHFDDVKNTSIDLQRCPWGGIKKTFQDLKYNRLSPVACG